MQHINGIEAIGDNSGDVTCQQAEHHAMMTSNYFRIN